MRSTPDTPNRYTAALRRLRAALWAMLGLGLLALWVGCSPEKHYKTLSFFFDGVPDPNAPKAGGGGTGGSRQAAAVVAGPPISFHKPFRDKNCASCHASASGGNVLALGAESCVPCHKQTQRAYAHMHDAVTAGACLWCHAPHESAQPALLRASGHTLCSQCHDAALLPPDPEHQERGRDCLECHVGHGSSKPKLLRPATQPAGARPAAING